MAGALTLDFTALRKGMVLGPKHHQFRLIKPVSNSPIGQVWHAHDLTTGSKTKEPAKVALEIFNPQVLKGSNMEAFKRQVTLCKQLESPHIASTYGYFTSREGWLFVAMEPTTTRSLARILLEDGYQQLSVKKVRIILSQVAKALDYIHKRGISHGDLSPWNIIITPGTGAKLVNVAFRQSLLAQIQNQGMRLLNTEFHAPEAFQKLPLDNSADIYSFGCLAYQLFDGRPPFSPEQPLEMRDPEHLEAPKQLSEEQWQVLKPALSGDPSARPESAVKLVQALFPAGGSKAQEQEVAPSATESTAQAAEVSTLSSGSTTEPRSFSWGLDINLKGVLIGLLLFSAGIAVGYFATQYYLQQQYQQQLAKLIEIQDILAEPANSGSKVAATQALAELKIISHDQDLIDALQKQVDSFKQRVDDKAAAQARPKPILITPEGNTGNLAGTEDSQSAFVPGAVFKDELMPNVYGPNMVVIPSGWFTMGDQNRRGDDNELPRHRVTIEEPFALSQYEVTFEEYDTFALSTNRPLPDDEGWGRKDRPVMNVSWNDANAYADWLRRQTGLPYRLPTEAEWEYAARAKTTTAFWWGNDKGRNLAACDDCGSRFDGRQTAPVGSFEPNPFGLYDMNGNVYEWVSDCYNETYENAPDDGSSWNVGQCNLRVMRGGSWYDISRLARSASRYRHPPDAERSTWGFRVALDLEP